MAGWCEEAVALLQRPAAAEMAVDVLLCAVPIWAAVMIGLVVGWSWRPRWTGLLFLGLRTRLRIIWLPPGLGARRLWFACTALSACSVAPRLLSSAFRRCRGKQQDKASPEDTAAVARDGGGCADGRTNFEGEHDTVTEKDLELLLQLLDNKESGDTAWQNLMERTTSNMTYKAWRREPEEGPIMYCSRTIFEDATPELVRDFFWDGDFRLKWDPMLAYSKSLDEFPQNGATIVHWIKKVVDFVDFPNSIADESREKATVKFGLGVPYPSLPKKEKPRRVELYFSSWRIRAVQSPKHVGQQSACEVTLVHYEDMGIPKDVARVAVRHGMWGAVKKLQSGFRAYQQMRDTENTLSHSAIMARMTTRVSITASNGGLDHDLSIADKISGENDSSHAVQHGFDWKWVVFGGAVAAVCVLNTGLVGKVLLLGAARRQAKK
ncbi:Polyketide cyclase/dehydrase and lipid transport superfamily protein [Zea mays]|uniref:Polyketide cyclase/dehydrase and lipid transport superfamily protein n=1 Tax=Zea mays TaxID=4577 RepID=A0A1D6JD66_MAIZE|nr:Polyketide cyclase/dehydrase and lipid transport superfamily protein [Zea mays]